MSIVHMVQEALENSIASIEKYLDERMTRTRVARKRIGGSAREHARPHDP